MSSDIRDLLCDMGHEEAVVFDNPEYDGAIVGVTDESQVVYDFDAMVKILVERDGMTTEEAIEFIEFNTIRAIPYAGPHAPIVMTKVEREEE